MMSARRFKILYITHARDLSGANSSMLQLITELRDNHNVDPFVLYPKRKPNGRRTIADVLKEKGIEGAACGRMVCYQREHTGPIYKFYYIISDALNLIQLLWICRNKRFDCIHTNTSILDIGLYASLLLRIPHIWHLREVAWISYNFRPIFGARYMKWLYNKSKHIIAISENVKTEFAPYIPEERTTVIYNGVLPPEIVSKPDFNAAVFKLCVVGRVEENKNQIDAIKAVELLTKEGIQNIKLFIVGDYNNAYGCSLVEYIQSHSLSGHIEFLGVRNDVDALLQSMHIGLMLSRHEAFGRVTVEYMQHGLFTIASNTSANTEIIQNNVNGFLYEFGHPGSLAAAIKNVVLNANMIKPIAECGFHDAMEKYSSINNSEKVYKLYSDLL